MATSGLAGDLASLDRFGKDADGGFNRLAWSAELRRAVEWLAGTMREAGLSTELDAAGNLIGRWEVGGGPPLVIGSHLDTVESGGRFDGALGVLAGVDVVRRLQAAEFVPARPLWVVAFMDEEGERFGTAMVGSRAIVGELTELPADLEDSDGVTLETAMEGWDRSPRRLGEAKLTQPPWGYLELHIEAGPVLEEDGFDIGAVTVVAGIAAFEVTIEGRASHAGATPFNARRDALLAASRLVVELRDRAVRGDYLATVGRLAVEPGGISVIPGKATLTVDFRADTATQLDAATADLGDALAGIREAGGVESRCRPIYRLEPLPMAAELIAAIEAAAGEVGARCLRMASGAAHDAMVIGRHAPAGMIFVPSFDGISHSPLESTSPEQVEVGARVLAATVRRLCA